MPSDYISKSALEKGVEENKRMNPCAKKAIFDALDTAKILDLVPCPIKCGECKFQGTPLCGFYLCKGKMPEKDFYCRDGRRKEQK